MPQLRSFTLKNKRLLPSQTWKDSGKGPELGPREEQPLGGPLQPDTRALITGRCGSCWPGGHSENLRSALLAS